MGLWNSSKQKQPEKSELDGHHAWEKKKKFSIAKNIWKLCILNADRTYHVFDIIAVISATLTFWSFQASFHFY